MDEPRFEHLYDMTVDLEPPQMIGGTPQGNRQIFYVRSGTFEGPRLKGELLPGGGDWFLLRPDKRRRAGRPRHPQDPRRRPHLRHLSRHLLRLPGGLGEALRRPARGPRPVLLLHRADLPDQRSRVPLAQPRPRRRHRLRSARRRVVPRVRPRLTAARRGLRLSPRRNSQLAVPNSKYACESQVTSKRVPPRPRRMSSLRLAT